MKCSASVPIPLGVCLNCGGSVLWASMEGEDYAVEAGPVASMNFRNQAVEFLENQLDRIDPVATEKLLKASRVRVAEGLDKDTAEGLRDGLGVQATTSRVTRGPTPKAGLAGAFRGGLPLLGLGAGIVLGLTPIGWTIGVVIGLAGAVGLGVMNAHKEMTVLGQAPVGPMSEVDINSIARRVVAAKTKLSQSASGDLDVIAGTAFAIIGKVTDPDDLVALGSGGLDAGVGHSAVQMATQAVLVAEGAIRQGRDDWSEEERGSIGRLKAAVTSAMSEMAQLSSGASGIDELEAMMAQEVEIVRETVDELDYLGA